jgi:hypothetical protein
MGNYATGTAPCGGVMGACAQVPRPSWNYCIAAESCRRPTAPSHAAAKSCTAP